MASRIEDRRRVSDRDDNAVVQARGEVGKGLGEAFRARKLLRGQLGTVGDFGHVFVGVASIVVHEDRARSSARHGASRAL